MSKLFKIFSLILVSFLINNSAHAAVVRFNTDINIGADEVITDNVYMSGGRVVVDGIINGDLVVAGGDVIINGVVKGDLIVLASETFLNGVIEGDSRVISAITTVTSSVGGDLLIAGVQSELTNTATVLGSLLAITDNIKLSQIDLKNLKIISRQVNIDGKISGDGDITVSNLKIFDNAQIAGELKYFSSNRGDISAGAATSSGQIIFNQTKPWSENGLIKNTLLAIINFWIILKFVTTVFLVFLLVNVFKIYAGRVNTVALEEPIRNTLMGMGSIVLIPLFVLISFISLFAFPIGILFGLGYLMAWVLAPSFAGIIVGSLLKRLFHPSEKFEFTFLSSILGVVLLTLIQFVPYVGNITKFIFTFLAIGALIRSLYINPNKRRLF